MTKDNEVGVRVERTVRRDARKKAKLEEAERDYQNEMKETDALKLRLVAASETDAKYRAQAAALAEALDELYAAVCCQRYAPTEDEWPLGVKVCALLTTYREGR